MTLDQRRETAFPTQAGWHKINADFRVALKIIRLLNDEDVFPEQRVVMSLGWFFVDETPENGLDLLLGYITGGDADSDVQASEPRFDWIFDAEEIYVSFLTDYRIDLFDVDFLHWHKFKMLFRNLSPDCAFKSKVRLRFMDLKGLKGKALSEARKAKKSVQLPQRMTWAELEMLRKYGGEEIWRTAR